jgi:hypothetical protein
MRLSFEQIIGIIKDFGGAHLQVKKVGADFESEMGVILTESEKYPALFASPLPFQFGENTNTITLKIFCLDVIQKDRQNLIGVISDTALILNDLFLYLTEGEDRDLETNLIGDVEPINNSQLDYLAGNSMVVSITVESYSSCEIPMGDIMGESRECLPVEVFNSDNSYFEEIKSGSVLQLPDTIVTIFVNGILNKTVNIVTLGNDTLNITA